MELNQETLNDLREQGKKDLFFFARAILGFHEMTPIIHKPICDGLANYKIHTRITVELPRTWFKSTTVSVAYAIWRAIRNPNIRILIAQNTHDNACKKLASIKDIFEKNHLFRALYAEILPNKSCRWSGECLEVNRTKAHPEGTFEAAGVGTATTSRHYDLIIEDDTISPKKDDMTGIIQQPTQMDIEKAIGWHGLCHPMLLHPRDSQVVIVGTRWAERDLLGYIYENYPEYINFRRTAIEDENGNAIESASLDATGTSLELKPGEVLAWPDRFDLQTLTELFKVEGPYMFACLYLGRPTAAINQVFRREWITYYDKIPRGCYTCTSVDLASAEKEESSDPDYNVIITTAIEPKTGKIFVLDYTRERMSPGRVIDTILLHHKRYDPIKVKIEAIGYQRTLIHWLKQKRKKTGDVFSIEEIRSHKQSKVDRIRGLQPFFADKLVAIKTWMTELEQELLAFPKGQHDDLPDALSMQIDFWAEMVHAQEILKPEKIVNAFSGGAIIDELMGRFDAIDRYPYDGGIMDDYYLEEHIKSEALRRRILNRSEKMREDSLLFT